MEEVEGLLKEVKVMPAEIEEVFMSKKFARGVRRVVVATVGFGLEGFLVVGEVEGAVDVLDDDDGFGGGGDEELAEVGVGVDGGEFEVIEVEVEEMTDPLLHH
ncbi:uncharacterized protein A4U43_C09F6520 [Asparagus officinalis]|uniref:Uncharacterized protein n=1 Tax=Asparagus officinalis TaxID=4686 RepID=A0A5P1E693_ASPOF|nr:uncharacterized protein A4U43_C09F6520 [Asparagus officinalis]